ncbi:MAG: type 4a pilus biogenesis protein PilO [Deltaproteobacteria bacterium]|nr:type 4a pilus biogenesis protein PilO [Deltaproteobacteria bacterium]
MNGDALRRLKDVDFSFLKSFKREALAVGVLVILSLLFYRFGYKRNIDEMHALRSGSEALRSEIQMAEAQSRASEGLSKAVSDATVNLKTVEGRLKSLKERLPSDKQVSRILSEFSESDFPRGIRIVSIKPLEPEAKGELSRLPFHIKMEAKFQSFGDYLERIERLPRLMVVDNFMIEGGDAADLTAEVYLSAYILSYGR